MGLHPLLVEEELQEGWVRGVLGEQQEPWEQPWEEPQEELLEELELLEAGELLRK